MTSTVKLPARLDLPAATKLVADVTAMDLSGKLEFDATEVTHLGALCAQALIATAAAAKSAGGSIEITNTSDRVVDQLAAMGLSPEFIMEGAV